MTAIIISISASLISGGALFFFLQRYFKKKDKLDEERDAVLAEENVLILKSINAVGKLTYANALAIRDGKQNGHMLDALKGYEEVNDELYQYLLERNAHK